MKHKALLITLICMIFCAVCILCAKELFSVKDITINYSIKTEQAEDIMSLLEKYEGKSMFTVNTEKIKEEITANRYLKVLSVKKRFPNEIVIDLIERTELFYYSNSSGVHYFDNEYFVVRSESEHKEGAPNLIEVELIDITGSPIDANCPLKKVFELPEGINEQVDRCLSGAEKLMDDIKKITVVYTTEKGNYRIKLHLREGGAIEIRKANDMTFEKAQYGANYFLGLEEARKISGTVIVDISDGGQIKASHTFAN